jgi:DegV family protein with EDD domain
MAEYIIMTDSSADLPDEYIKENQICMVPLHYIIDGEIYGEEKVMEVSQFYDAMRKGMMPTTNAVNPDEICKKIEPYLQAGTDVLMMAFSSALSSTCQNMKIVADEMKTKYPDRKILAIDTLCASLGQGLAVHKAVQMKKAGLSIEETATQVQQMLLHICHFFTVDDLYHLQRGGRVSKATAVVGSMLQVKPILHVDNEGRLIKIDAVRGRKKSLNAIVKKICACAKTSPYPNDVFFVSHGDCLEDAEYVAKKIQEETGIKDFMIAPVGPVIGTHSGPGTLAVFMMGCDRG